MRLDGPRGSSFELSVLAYQYPDIGMDDPASSYDYDANWLIVDLRFSKGSKSWGYRGPEVLWWELAKLATWLDGIADGGRPDSVEFMEPGLAFALISEPDADDVVRLTLEVETRPPGPRLEPRGSVWLDLSAGPGPLRQAASDLRAELETFPVRWHTDSTQSRP